MEKFKIILNYVLGFILSLLVLCIILFGILKCTVFNPNYIKNALNKNNYYETIETNIHESMEAYMMSSGLPNDILNNLYTKKEIKNEVDNFIDNLFNGQN